MGLDLTLTFNYEPIILIAKLAPIARKSPVMGACGLSGLHVEGTTLTRLTRENFN